VVREHAPIYAFVGACVAVQPRVEATSDKVGAAAFAAAAARPPIPRALPACAAQGVVSRAGLFLGMRAVWEHPGAFETREPRRRWPSA
jgi:hypothetical protein